jgi:hypothetical protein
MGVGGVSYPISEQVKHSLTRFPEIAARLKLPAQGRSEFEIVRILDNTHYAHLVTLLSFVEQWLGHARPIGDRVIRARDPFQLEQALAELFLFAHLAAELGGRVHAARGLSGESTPDLKLAWNDKSVCIEVFSPVDFMGFQLVQTHVTNVLRYLHVSRGYVIEAGLRPARERDLWYPYAVEDESKIKGWLREFAAGAEAWLKQQQPPERKVINGPKGEWYIDLLLHDMHDDSSIRRVILSTRTHSTDTRLFFDCGAVEDTAKSQWGKKIKSKLKDRQCGDPAPDKLRVMVIDFSQASTSCPDFICWPDIATRMEATIKLLATELHEPLPYDLVIPAQLGYECCFGPGIVLDPVRQCEASEFMRVARLDRPCMTRQGNEVDWLAPLFGDDA